VTSNKILSDENHCLTVAYSRWIDEAQDLKDSANQANEAGHSELIPELVAQKHQALSFAQSIYEETVEGETSRKGKY
jgi:hypothetical protein